MLLDFWVGKRVLCFRSRMTRFGGKETRGEIGNGNGGEILRSWRGKIRVWQMSEYEELKQEDGYG